MRTFIVLLLPLVFEHALAATFGDQATYTTQAAIKDAIYGLKASPASGGACESVTVYFSALADSVKLRCALYTISGSDTILVANGQTEERRFPSNSTPTWAGFAFVGSKPIVAPGIDYFICVFADTAGSGTGGNPRARVNTSGPGSVLTKSANYESGYPSPINPVSGNLNYKMSIYATYTPTGSSGRRRILLAR